MKDYNQTPSFYNNEEVFKKYLGRTSYYLSLQNAVAKVISLLKPKHIVELGSGTGATVNRIASENKESEFIAVDVRDEMVKVGQNLSNEMNNKNVLFISFDMVKYINECNTLPEFIYMLYSFHHIEDPIDNKHNFLKSCFGKMDSGSRLCIAEAFLPEHTNYIDLQANLKKIWASRSFEGYASTLWESIETFDEQGIEKAREIGRYSYNNEWIAGELVAERDNEYLVTINWLCDTAKEIGFNIDIAEPCNNNGDYVVVLKK